MICKFFFPLSKLPFHFVHGFLCYAGAFQFDVVSLVYFCFCCLCLWSNPKNHCQGQCQGAYCLFSSRNFMVSGLTFESLIHFELTFVYGVREESSFILLHVAVQFSQHHLLRDCLSPLYILSAFVIN